MLQARINFGVVRHQRIRQAKNAFGYGVFTISIPMRTRKTNPHLLQHQGLSDNRWGLCAFFIKITAREQQTVWHESKKYLRRIRYGMWMEKSGYKPFQESWDTFSIQ